MRKSKFLYAWLLGLYIYWSLELTLGKALNTACLFSPKIAFSKLTLVKRKLLWLCVILLLMLRKVDQVIFDFEKVSFVEMSSAEKSRNHLQIFWLEKYTNGKSLFGFQARIHFHHKPELFSSQACFAPSLNLKVTEKKYPENFRPQCWRRGQQSDAKGEGQGFKSRCYNSEQY